MRRLWWHLLASNRVATPIVAALGVLGGVTHAAWPWFGVACLTVAAVALLGVLKFFWFDARLGLPPGAWHSVRGQRMHMLAEGETRGRHPVIWVGGGHGEGLVMFHLHRAMAGETRSILFDRAGAGWSDFGPLPLTIQAEVEQLKLLLDAAGESGPYVIAGHSFGGLFSVNFAHRYPELVAALVLMDPTPPANVTFAGRLSFGTLVRKAPWRALALQFGLKSAGDPEISDADSPFHACLHEWADVINRNSLQPKSVLSEAAAFDAAMANPFDMVIGSGALGDTPLSLLLANPSAESDAEMRSQVRSMLALNPKQEENFWAAMDESMEHQLALSRDSVKTLAPPGSSHMFPYEHPQFVLDAVRRAINKKPAGGAATG